MSQPSEWWRSLPTTSFGSSLLEERLVHQAFFEKEGSFSPNIILWWERFQLVEVLDSDLAAKSEAMVALNEADAAELLANQPC